MKDEIKDERKKKKNRIGNDGLMIEGRSKVIEDVRSHDKVNRYMDKELREELKRIYKVRHAGQSYDSKSQKNNKMERSIILPPIRL